jgi:hypothetical protein
MCDYSLMAVPNRLARQGEELEAYRFPTGSLGFASSADLRRAAEPEDGARRLWSLLREFLSPPRTQPVAAVCIPPGASLRLRDIPVRMRDELGVCAAEDVTFTQLTAAANAYRDAIRFSNGRVVRLQELDEGQRALVLDLSMAEELDLEKPRSERLEFAFRPR